MVSTLAGIGIALTAAALVGAFIGSAARTTKRPTLGSILVALLGVPFAAASVSRLTAGPLDLLGRIHGLSIVAWLAATAIMAVLCAIGRHFLASVMSEHKGPQAGDVMRGAQLYMADRWHKRAQRMQAKDASVMLLAKGPAGHDESADNRCRRSVLIGSDASDLRPTA